MVSKNILYLTIFLSAIIFQNSYSLTEQDLNNSYNGAKTQLATMRQDISSLPQSQQQDLLNEVNTAASQVDQAYQKAENAIANYKNSKDYQATVIVDRNVRIAEQSINRAMSGLQSKVSSVVNVYNQLQARQQMEEAQKKAAALTAQKAQRQQQLARLMTALNAVLPDFNKIKYDMQNFMRSFKGDIYNVQEVQDFSDRIQQVASKALQIYKQENMPISFDDQSNLVVILIKYLSDFYNSLVFHQFQFLQKSRLSDKHFQELATLAQQIMGTPQATSALLKEGYNGAFNQAVKNNFSDSSSQNKMMSYYLQRQIDITYIGYNNALTSLIIYAVKPTDLHRSLAQILFQFIAQQIQELPADKTKQVLLNANHNMAQLYVTSAQNILKSMQLKDTTDVLLNNVIDFYKQAISFFTNAQDVINAQLYQNFVNNLSQGKTTRDLAQNALKSNNTQQAIKLFTQAQDYFKQGGDGVDANKISILLSDLIGQNSLNSTQQLINQFIATNKSQLQEYLSYISTLDKTKNIASFGTLLQNLLTLYQTSYNNYVQALNAYQEIIKDNPSLQQSAEEAERIQNITTLVSLLDAFNQAQTALLAGDEILASRSSTALDDASTHYSKALELFALVDKHYKENNQLVHYFPRYFDQLGSNENYQNFTDIAQQHIARYEIEIADSITTDLSTALLYYNNADTRQIYLSSDIDKYLVDKISELTGQSTVVNQVLAAAQAAQQAAVALTADAWKPRSDSIVYASDGVDAWKNVIQHYVTLYKTSSENFDEFIKVLQEFVTAYEKNVPAEYFPSIGTALIKYYAYILYSSQKDTANVQALLKEIEVDLNQFFDQGEQLAKRVSDSANLLTTATPDQLKIMVWAAHADDAIEQQESIIDLIDQTLEENDRASLLILEKTVSNKSTVYSILPTKRSFTLPNILETLANLYKEIGDYYLKTKNYERAYPNYYLALQTYQKGNIPLPATFQDQLAKADTLYWAAEYRDLVIPGKNVALYGFNVPENYFLKVYGTKVPQEFSDNFGNLDFMKTDQVKTTQFLIDLGTQIYFYHKIADAFGSDQFDTVYNAITTKNLSSYDQDQRATILSIIDTATRFKSDFTARVTAKKSTLVLQEGGTKESPIFMLYEYYVPVPQFEDLVNFYQGYPTALNYYTWSAYLFAPGDPTESITIGSKTLPHGNDADSFAQMNVAQMNVYLSQAYSYKAQIDFIKSGSVWNQLMKLDKNNLALEIDAYMPLRDAIKKLYNSMITYLNGPIGNTIIASTNPLATQINTIIGNSYKNLGDDLLLFLKGDPLSHNFTDIIKDSLGNYVTAIITYNYSSNLYSKLADVYKQAGDLLYTNKKYFDSLSFYYTAATLYGRVIPVTDQTKTAAQTAQLAYLEAMYKGSLENIYQFYEAQKNGVTVSLSSGSKESISFNDLLTKYLAFINQTGGVSTQALDSGELDESNDLKALLLDGLIFLNGTNIQTQPIIDLLVSDSPTKMHVAQQGLSLIDSLSEHNTISFDSLDTVTLMMSRTDFPDGNNFALMLENGFDQFKQKIEQSADSVSKAVGYSAIGQLALKLYVAFGYIYMENYLGGVSADAETSLTGAVQAEVNQILSQSSQYIGN